MARRVTPATPPVTSRRSRLYPPGPAGRSSMNRVRGAGQAVRLLLVLASLSLVGPVSPVSPAAGGARLVAAVAWPVSTLVVSEVQTGGASASDEFAEVSNAGSVVVDLMGLEVAYA